eukprot:scaffold43213_cov72-Phaeocystis_antarctica.AAC.3
MLALAICTSLHGNRNKWTQGTLYAARPYSLSLSYTSFTSGTTAPAAGCMRVWPGKAQASSRSRMKLGHAHE